jgi:hypothetical protein
MISDEYKQQLSSLHKKAFGSGKELHPEAIKILDTHNINTLLDFGCGKGHMSDSIKEKYPELTLYSYDPITSPIEIPNTVEMIFSSDVLEHVEPEYIDQTLDTLFNIATKFQYHLIACSPAKKNLPDGRNAHLIVESPLWWKNKLEKYGWNFEFEEVVEHNVQRKDTVLHVIKYIIILRKSVK